ncbi:ATP-binding protein [Paenibacillus sp. EC2-1]|uniref:ATP-binding protein n=1 Tax=Paenibacillus sp. EC2-1 TaxID=3388665 RepID=UPI003BEF1911
MIRIMKDKFVIILVLATLFVGFIMTLSAEPNYGEPVVKQGVLDLRDWDSREQPLFSLDGEWEFYPGQLLKPGDITGNSGTSRFIQVPGKWDNWSDGNGISMQAKGYGTYRLVVKNAPQGELLAVIKNYVRFADKLYINGTWVGSSGEPAATREEYTPRNVPYTAYFKNMSNEIEILLQSANYDYKEGGVANSLYFGLAKDIQVRKGMLTGLDISGVIIWLFISVLMLGMYFWFHRNQLLLLFGIYFAMFAVSVLSNGERILLQLLPGLPFELAFKIKLMSVFAAPALFFLISWKLLDKSRIRTLILAETSLLFLYVAVIAVLPFRMYSQAQDIMYMGMTLTLGALVCYLAMIYMKGHYGRLNKRQFQLYFASAWALLMLALNIILSYENLTSIFLNNAIGFLFLISVLALLIHQYVQAYHDMDTLTKRLQLADRMKDEFLYITSHELNTPLNGIMNVSRALLDESSRRVQGPQETEQLLMIRNTAFRMSSMVNDIIDATHIRHGQLDLRLAPVDLVSCISVVMEVSRFLAKSKNIQMVPAVSPEARYVYADEGRLTQVLYNVIHHKLTDVHEGDIHISTVIENGQAIIRIESDGDSSDRGHSSDAQAQENGFAAGLTVARELVELMGGRITGGHEVSIQLPLAEQSVASGETAATAEGLLKRDTLLTTDSEQFMEGTARILIASANPIDVEHLFSMLTTEGYNTYCIGSAQKAYEQISGTDRPDLVLVDVMLPEVNGFELCRWIRQDFTQTEMPILLISSRSTSADIEAGISAGASDFITRPLDPGEVRVRINTLLAMKRLVREAAVNEMAFLRSQIKPHFIYNALGTIMSFCYTDGVRAGELLGIFSRYLRSIFHLDNTEDTVKLSKELELIEAYVDIEKARFGERVNVEFDIDRELYHCNVMPLTIEPLVENAILHGITKQLDGGTVRLGIHRDGVFVRVVVEDDGVGMTPEQIKGMLDTSKRKEGVGFRNTMRRIAHMTGRAPVIQSELGQGTRVTIWLPLLFSEV